MGSHRGIALSSTTESETPRRTFLGEKLFAFDDQDRFARWSGDVNPMHMDPIAARRTQLGRVVVHGVHLVVWALDALCASGAAPINSIKVRFSRPTFVGDRVLVSIGSHNSVQARLSVLAEGVAAASITVTFGDRGPATASPAASLMPSPEWPGAPIERADQDIVSDGAVSVAPSAAEMAAAFPALAGNLGEVPLAGLGCLSRLVGMVCPGLHSIFGAVHLDLTHADPLTDGICFSARYANADFRAVELSVAGCGLRGQVEAIARAPPVRQPAISEIALQVGPREFEDARCLVIGGTRGLGEVASKILAAGGAQVVLTYAVGRQDAQKVSDEITAFGGRSEIAALDVRQPVDIGSKNLPFAPTHIYYFATCPIAVRRANSFDADAFNQFQRFYVDAFAELCDGLAEKGSAPVRVFYPSTIAIEARPRGMTEYTMAKAAGEILCADINRYSRAIDIVMDRLPRLATDLTATHMQIEMPPVIDVLLPLIRRVQDRGQVPAVHQ